MFKRLHIAAAFAVSLFALAPSAGLAQAPRGITVEWQDAPLSDVVKAFARLSGRTIVVAPDVGDPAVTALVQNVEWERALDIILMAHALVARVDASGVIHIEKQRSAPARP